MVSSAEGKDGQPLCTLAKKGSGYELSVLTMEYCEVILKAASDNKIAECRACLEGKAPDTTRKQNSLKF